MAGLGSVKGPSAKTQGNGAHRNRLCRQLQARIHLLRQVFDASSVFGIEQGRISKLQVRHGDRTVMNYDRGWDQGSRTAKPARPQGIGGNLSRFPDRPGG
jgi:hypothetical protein